MESFRLTVLSVISLILVVLLGYWAFFTIEPGGTHVDRQKQRELETKNEELQKEVEELKDELASLQALQEQEQTPAAQEPTPKPPETPTSTSTSSKHQSLINELQKLINDKVFMKEKSKGTRVGTIQNFLNIYNKTSNKIDNDYGKSTKDAVIKFQKAVGLTADGETGPSTYQKMIDWLKKQ